MKKGFTLVEVLAVVVVLSIIAVIVTPVVGNIIEDEKIKGAILSAYGYKESVDSIYAKNLLTGNKLDGEYAISGDELIGDTILELNIGGVKPTGGYVLYRNSELQDACLIINGYQVRYDNNKFYSDGKGDCKNLTWAYYYTFDNEGKRSNIVYKESDIPSDWNYYYKVVFGENKVKYMGITESQLIDIKDTSEVNVYSSLKECELNDGACLSTKKIDVNYQNGDFGYLIDYQRYSILKTAEEVGIAEQYMGAICEAYENKYAYVLKGGSEDKIRSLYDTLEQCENSKGNVYSATDECVLSSGYFCRYSRTAMFKIDSREINGLGSVFCSLNGYETKSFITSSFNKVTSCRYIKKQNLDMNVYSGNFATLEECNSYVNSISATTEATCVPYSGYASKYVTQAGSEWRYNYPTLEKCQLDTGETSYYTCEPSLGYAVKIHTVSSGIPWDGDNTCEDLPNWLAEKDINSCTYDYINKNDISSEDIYYGFKSLKYEPSKLYDTMDACLADNLTCVGTESTILSKEIFINIPEKNMKIAYNNNYDSLKNTMNDLFGNGIEFTIQDEDEESGIIHTQKYSFYSTTNKSINDIISMLGIEEYQEEDKVMTLLTNAAYNDSIAFIANEHSMCYLGIYGNFYISYLNQFMISKLSKQFHIELDNDTIPILIDIPGSNDQIIYHNSYVKNVATLTSKYGTGKSISNNNVEATFFSMNGENINSIIDSYNLTNPEEILDRVIEDNEAGIHKIAAAVKNGSNNLMLLNTKEYLVMQGTFTITDTTNL